ncbi:ParB N-terminal domain-containing protein [bacterium]|nr:ParB N-terminal domain-containing protein [bacterium]
MPVAEIRIEDRRLEDLTPAEYNPRTISESALGGLKASIERFGLVQPIIVNSETGNIVGGHQRFRVLQQQGIKQTRVVVVDLPPDEEKALNLTLNNPGICGEFTDEALPILAELRELPEFEALGLDDLLLDLDRTFPESVENLVAATAEKKQSLIEEFIVPPFTVLDSRQGYWQERKKKWLALGLNQRLGGRETLQSPGSLSGTTPNYFAKKERCESVLGREMSNEEFQGKYLEGYLPGGSAIETTDGGGILSLFDPVLCEIAYQWFCPQGGNILDPFAGGAVRGVVAAITGRHYTGIDLREEQVLANRDLAKTVIPDDDVRWITGDSLNVRKLAEDEYDFLFTCPPYGDLEIYSDDPADLSNMAWSEFQDVYRKIIAESCSMLKPDRFACFVVGDLVKARGICRDLPGDTIAAFKDAGLELYNSAVLIVQAGSLPIRIRRQFQGTRKLGRCHQSVLVFLKGDAKEATKAVIAACG